MTSLPLKSFYLGGETQQESTINISGINDRIYPLLSVVVLCIVESNVLCWFFPQFINRLHKTGSIQFPVCSSLFLNIFLVAFCL